MLAFTICATSCPQAMKIAARPFAKCAFDAERSRLHAAEPARRAELHQPRGETPRWLHDVAGQS